MKSLVAIVLLAAAHAGSAQVRFGQRIGATVFKQQLVETADYEGPNIYRNIGYDGTGLAAGAFLDVPMNEHLFIGTEVSYSERGYRLPVDKPVRFTQEIVKSSFVGLTILPKYWIGSGRTKLELFVGADVALRLNLREEGGRFLLVTETGSYDVFGTRSKYMAGQDYSLVVGFGLVSGTGPVKFHLNWRYLYGLSNVYDREVWFTDANGSPLASGRMYNRGMHFSIGLSVPLSASGWATPQPVLE